MKIDTKTVVYATIAPLPYAVYRAAKSEKVKALMGQAVDRTSQIFEHKNKAPQASQKRTGTEG